MTTVSRISSFWGWVDSAVTGAAGSAWKVGVRVFILGRRDRKQSKTGADECCAGRRCQQSVVHVHVLFYLREPCVMIDVCKAAPVLFIRVVMGAVQVVLGVVWVLMVVVRAVMGVVRVVQ